MASNGHTTRSRYFGKSRLLEGHMRIEDLETEATEIDCEAVTRAMGMVCRQDVLKGNLWLIFNVEKLYYVGKSSGLG